MQLGCIVDHFEKQCLLLQASKQAILYYLTRRVSEASANVARWSPPFVFTAETAELQPASLTRRVSCTLDLTTFASISGSQLGHNVRVCICKMGLRPSTGKTNRLKSQPAPSHCQIRWAWGLASACLVLASSSFHACGSCRVARYGKGPMKEWSTHP